MLQNMLYLMKGEILKLHEMKNENIYLYMANSDGFL